MLREVLLILGRPNFQSRGPKILVFEGFVDLC